MGRMRPKSTLQRERQELRGAPHARDAHCECCNAEPGEDCRGKHELRTGYHYVRAQLANEHGKDWRQLSDADRQSRIEAFAVANIRSAERYHRGAAASWITPPHESASVWKAASPPRSTSLKPPCVGRRDTSSARNPVPTKPSRTTATSLIASATNLRRNQCPSPPSSRPPAFAPTSFAASATMPSPATQP